MPTLGPFFKWLRPNHWKHVAIGPKSLGNSRYEDPEALERVWPRPSKTPSDDTLLAGSAAMTPDAAEGKHRTFSYSMQAHLGTGQMPRETWLKAEKKGGSKDEIELVGRERASQSP